MEKDIVVVNGQEIEMETKLCEGGCGMAFRVKKGSRHAFARFDCESVCRDIVPNYKEKLAEREKIRKELLKIEKERRKEDKQKFRLAVEECRGSTDKFFIAGKALPVSFLRSDPPEKRLRMSGLSASNFARELGIDPKALAMWMRVKRDFIDVVGENVYVKGTFHGALRALRLAAQENKPLKEVFLRESKKKG